MKIQAINNKQNQYNQTTNFKGKLILPENLSKMATEYVNQSKETLIVYAKKLPYDVRLKELPKRDKNNKPILILIKDGEELKQSVIEKIIETMNDGVDHATKMKEFAQTLFETIGKMDYLKTSQIHEIKNKPHVPKTIGNPQKPFVKRKKIHNY